MVVHSWYESWGSTDISRLVFDNVAAAVAGWSSTDRVAGSGRDPAGGRRTVAVTMLGNTPRAVMALRDEWPRRLHDMVFHSTASGGRPWRSWRRGVVLRGRGLHTTR
jgi:uncharacterized protein (UPF0261 family)